MTAIAEPSDPSENDIFEDWNDAITTPPPGSSESEEARSAAGWILTIYLYASKQPGRLTYYQKVAAWAQSDMALFGKLGTAVGTYAKDCTGIACVGYWSGKNGSTIAWDMDTTSGVGRYLIAGERNAANVLQDLILFDVTGVKLSADPTTAELQTNNKWARLTSNPAYKTLTDTLSAIKTGSFNWPND